MIRRVLCAAVFIACAAQAAPVTDAQRIEAARAIERARYEFVIGTKPPFDERYPQTFFVTQMKKEAERERVLRQQFGIAINSQDLAREFERVEKSTRARDQWEAMKAAVHDDRLVVEEVVCRPLLIDRILRVKFAFDQRIHAVQHEQARRARAEFLAGREPPYVNVLRISRHQDRPQWTDEMLRPATVDAQADPASVLLEAEARATLERELHRPGDVSTILEYPDRFEVYRLQEITSDFWRVGVVSVAKRGFDSWYEEVQKKTK